MRISLRFAWYDLWVGAFYDRKTRTLYICPLPTILLTLAARRERERDERIRKMEARSRAWEGIAESAQRGVRLAREFGEAVLLCDTYGCENGADKCLHADARRFLAALSAEDATRPTGDKE